jgi:hypothetical protein
MAQNGGLGLAGRSAGEQQHAHVRIDVRKRFASVGRVAAGGLEGASRDDGDAGRGLETRHHVVVDNGGRGRGAGKQLAEVGVGQAVVERGEGPAEQAARKDGDRQGGTIQPDIDHGQSGLAGQPGGPGPGPALDLSKGHPVGEPAESEPVGGGVRGHVEKQGRMHSGP